jgi:cytochrome c-type biogenesis protein CcmH/NrfG
LEDHQHPEQAEQAYRMALELVPSNPEAMVGLARALDSTGRGNEAQQLLDDFIRKHPDQTKTINAFRGSILGAVQSATR